MLAAKRSRSRIIAGKYVVPSKEKAGEAAVKIQRYWRFYRIMRVTRVRTQRLYVTIGNLKYNIYYIIVDRLIRDA